MRHHLAGSLVLVPLLIASVASADWPAGGASLRMFGESIRDWAVGFTSDDSGFTWMEGMRGGPGNIMDAHLIDAAG